MRLEENFEQTFEEQLQTILADGEISEIDLENLPDGLHRHPDFPHYCFKFPEPDIPANSPAELLATQIWDPDSRKRSASILRDFADDEVLKDRLLRGLDSAAQVAAARILAILVCAEESAVNIFHYEAHRVEQDKIETNLRAIREIETEERIHDWLIQKARTFYPVPDDIHSIRRRTRRLFMRVASRDLGLHFARISGLDSGVCICLTALLGSGKVNRAEGFAQLLRHIRRDESTHVKKSRIHAQILGHDGDFGPAYSLTREGIVGMLTPIAESFEIMGVDSDRLFKRLVRFHTSKETVG